MGSLEREMKLICSVTSLLVLIWFDLINSLCLITDVTLTLPNGDGFCLDGLVWTVHYLFNSGANHQPMVCIDGYRRNSLFSVIYLLTLCMKRNCNEDIKDNLNVERTCLFISSISVDQPLRSCTVQCDIQSRDQIFEFLGVSDNISKSIHVTGRHSSW